LETSELPFVLDKAQSFQGDSKFETLASKFVASLHHRVLDRARVMSQAIDEYGMKLCQVLAEVHWICQHPFCRNRNESIQLSIGFDFNEPFLFDEVDKNGAEDFRDTSS
jgi:hypothetical protein